MHHAVQGLKPLIIPRVKRPLAPFLLDLLEPVRQIRDVGSVQEF